MNLTSDTLNTIFNNLAISFAVDLEELQVPDWIDDEVEAHCRGSCRGRPMRVQKRPFGPGGLNRRGPARRLPPPPGGGDSVNR